MTMNFRSLLAVALGAALLTGCSGGGSSNAPEGAGNQGASDPAAMAVPPTAEISPDDAGGAPAADTPTATP